MERLKNAGRLVRKGNTVRFRRYWEDYPASVIGVNWTDTGTGGFVGDEKVYVVQTDSRAVERCLLMTTDPGDIAANAETEELVDQPAIINGAVRVAGPFTMEGDSA